MCCGPRSSGGAFIIGRSAVVAIATTGAMAFTVTPIFANSIEATRVVDAALGRPVVALTEVPEQPGKLVVLMILPPWPAP